jgi:rubredoxin
MHSAKCILCGHDAQSNVFKEAEPDERDQLNVAPGEKYICPDCGLYALDNYEHNFVEHFATDDQKKILSEYVKNHPDEDGQFKVLRSVEIKKILKLL